jgi:hypothetical protein
VSDPSPLSTVETTALSEGIKFLYNQAAEVLRSWRERRSEAADSEPGNRLASVDAASDGGPPPELPEAFVPSTAIGGLDEQALAELADEVQALCRELQGHADGVVRIDAKDPNLLGLVDALRRCLEAIWRRPLEFAGEQRSPAAQQAVVEGRVNVREVAGYAAAVRAARLAEGTVRGQAYADRVWPGGQLLGVDLGSPVPPPPPPPDK